VVNDPATILETYFRGRASTPKRKLRVFLCYSSNDKQQVRKLYKKLGNDNIDVWFDQKNLLPGQEWEYEIAKAIANSDAIIVCLSNNSVTKEGFVQKEIRFALDEAEEKPEGTIFMIPALLENCEVPQRLSKRHWAKLFEKNGYSQLLKALFVRATDLGLNPGRLSEEVLKMDEKMEQVVEALRRYFDHADPDDDDFNARLIRDDLKRYNGELLLMGPAVIIDGLRNAVSVQLKQQIFLGTDEDSLDRQLKGMGLVFLMQYSSLVKAAGSASVMRLVFSLPLLLAQNEEDMVTIIAYVMGVLARSRLPMISSAVTNATNLLEDLFQQAHNTACKIALGYALFQCGRPALFKSYAVPRLSSPEQRHRLEQMLTPGDTQLQAWVVAALIMDVASNGQAFPSEAGWQRRR
jgi:hypothetical protein